MVLTSILSSFMISMFLLFKSMQPVNFSRTELENIWAKVDVDGKTWLGLQDMVILVRMKGVQLPDYEVPPLSFFEDRYVVQDGKVTFQSFMAGEIKDQKSSELAIFVFHFQTYALLAEGFYTRLAATGNVDVEEAVGDCLAPLAFEQRFIHRALVTPLMILLFVPVSFMVLPQIWRCLRMKCMKWLTWNSKWKVVLPDRILKVHAQRAALNVYLFVFAPVTLPAMEILSCTSPCDDADTCKHERRLAFDMSIECGTSYHIRLVIAAFVVLIILCVVIPAFLVRKSGEARRRRAFSLSLRWSKCEAWFEEIDADHSGTLKGEEFVGLLKKMNLGQGKDKAKVLEKVKRELHADTDGAVSKENYKAWVSTQAIRRCL